MGAERATKSIAKVPRAALAIRKRRIDSGMAADDISSPNWNENPASNTTAGATGWAANSSPSSVYTVVRDKMGAIKRDWNRSHTTISSTGSANAYVLTYATAPSALVNGEQYAFKASFGNTATATANINGLGATTINKQTSAGLVALASGDIATGQHCILEYDSATAVLVLLNPQAGATIPNTVANGLTGLSTITAHGVMMGEGTSPVAASSAGIAGQAFISGGASADGSYKNLRLVTTKTADYTLVAADQGGKFIMNSASAHTFTLPDDATVGNGWEVEIVNQGTGILSITRAGTDTIASGGSTALTSISLSQGDAGKIVADGVSHGIFWWSGTRHYDSGAQTITSGGALPLPHGLGVQPPAVFPWLHCVTAEAGYSIGDEVPISNGGDNDGTHFTGVAAAVDATNITARMGSTAQAFQILSKTTGSVSTLTNGNWKLIFRAQVLN